MSAQGQGLFEFFKLTADDDGPEKFDRIVVDFNFNNWLKVPSNVEQGHYSIGVSAYWFKDIPLGQKSNTAFAFGLGFDSHNVHHNGQFVYKTNSDGKTFTALEPLPIGYEPKKNKVSFNYLEAPFELRLRTMNKSIEEVRKFRFRMYLGFKAGVLLNNHVKLRDDHIKIKEFNLRNTLIYRYGPTLRIGFNKISFNAFYGLTSIFKEGLGENLVPFSIGISWMRF